MCCRNKGRTIAGRVKEKVEISADHFKGVLKPDVVKVPHDTELHLGEDDLGPNGNKIGVFCRIWAEESMPQRWTEAANNWRLSVMF